MKIVFFGTPHFSADVLEYLLAHGVDVAAVVSKPDRPVGRSGAPAPTPVKVAAQSQAQPIPVFQPEMVSAPDFASTLESFQADLFVVVAYGEILKQNILEIPKVACINLHTSLLPKYRGAAPIQRCLIEGAVETGVTIMHMAKKMDAGDIISIAKVSLGPNTTFGELEAALCKIGSKLLLEAILDFQEGVSSRTPQDHAMATIAPKIELEDCQIDWNSSAISIHNLVRGVNPYPGAWCFVELKGQKRRLKILLTRIAIGVHGKPGEIAETNEKGMVVACGEDALLIVELQLEGKKAMPAKEFLRGIPLDSLRFFEETS